MPTVVSKHIRMPISEAGPSFVLAAFIKKHGFGGLMTEWGGEKFEVIKRLTEG